MGLCACCTHWELVGGAEPTLTHDTVYPLLEAERRQSLALRYWEPLRSSTGSGSVRQKVG